MKRKEQKISLHMTTDMYDDLVAASVERDVPVAQIVREALKLYLGRD